MPGARRRWPCAVLALALPTVVPTATTTAGAAPSSVPGEPPGEVRIDDGSAAANPLDPSFLPAALRPGATGGKASVERLRADGSSGFRPFHPRSYDYGAYRFQLVSSGSDGDVEVLRSAVQAVAAELGVVTGITFAVDGGQVPRPASVARFPAGFCGGQAGHQCSLFDDADRAIGVIRVGFSSGSPCGSLAPAGTSQGTVGCGGPESVQADDGTVFHLRGNVWLSPSLRDVNAPLAVDVIAHEVGHAVGLDHYDAAYTAIPGGTPVRQLLYPAVHDDPTDTGLRYRTGDAQGLWWLHLPEAWFVTATYRDFLGRAPDTAGYHFWVAADVTREQYVRSLAASDEWVGQIVQRFYADVFGRAADPGGFAHWAGLVRTRGVPFVAAQLYGSPEYFERNGSTTTGFVQALYRQLLGRDPAADPAGVAYWVGEADRRGRTEVALAFFESEEKRRRRVRDLYCTLLDRPPDAAGSAYWAGVILTQGDLALATNLATSFEYAASADEFSTKPPSTPPPPGCA